ncbi:uncharacterized protein LOC120289966 [Eucalyptus grandis]|uniref:uncharacterized protein LOC120289966 n=1 Tax=Eucalyptus grandis TaxID=71139 RepID=UPI00192E83B4|nr:uncharacterized protein LOC120289966 [Eucalyptus grandis]
MAISSSKCRSNCHVRSISLPSRSHPTTLRTLDSINKLQSSQDEASTSLSGSVCAGLTGLEGVYVCMDDLLNMRSTQQTLSCSRQEGFINVLLDGSIQVLDVCDYSSQILLRLKEQVRALQSTLRRRKGEPCIEIGVAEYTNFRKAMKKDAKRLMAVLRKMAAKFEDGQLENENNHLSSVMRVVRDANLLSTSIFQSLLSFLATPVSRPNRQISRWSIVSKLVYPKGAISCDQEDKQGDVNELECVDCALTTMCKHMSREGVDGEKLQVAQCELEDLEIGIGRIEDALEGLHRNAKAEKSSDAHMLRWQPLTLDTLKINIDSSFARNEGATSNLEENKRAAEGVISYLEENRGATEHRGAIAYIYRDSRGHLVDGFSKMVAASSVEQAEALALLETLHFLSTRSNRSLQVQ